MPTKSRGEAALSRYNQAPPGGGVKRRRVGSSMRRSGDPSPSVPREWLDRAGDFRLQQTPATREQAAALRSFLAEHVRDVAIGLHPKFTAELLGEALKLSPATVKKRRAGGLARTQDLAEAELTARVLAGMAKGEFPGPLGCPSTLDVAGCWRSCSSTLATTSFRGSTSSAGSTTRTWTGCTRRS